MTDTARLAKQLANSLYADFADMFKLEAAVAKLSKRERLDDPAVIAALATCADLAPVQKRLAGLPAAALRDGLSRALAGELRDTAALLVRALHDAAARAATAKPVPIGKGKALPLFARPEWLPPLIDAKGGRASSRDDTEAMLRRLAAGELPADDYTPASLAAFGRALVLGWLAHGGDPKARWAALGPAPWLDDATARDLARYAAQIAPRQGLFAKAQLLVDVLGAIDSRAALAELLELATKLRTRSVKDRARAAFDAAAKRLGVTEHDLADKLMPAVVAPGKAEKLTAKAFLKRLEQRMVDGTAFTRVDFVENVLQHPIAQRAVTGVVLAAQTAGKRRLVTVVDGGFEDVAGKPVDAPAPTEIVVVHPLELSAKELAAWQRRLPAQPFAQLARPVEHFANAKALQRHCQTLRGRSTTPRKLFGLEGLGWRRGATPGGRFTELTRELLGVTAVLAFEPGVVLVPGMTTAQRVVGVRIVAKQVRPIAFGEIARELATL